MDEPEWALPMNRIEMIRRIEYLEALLRRNPVDSPNWVHDRDQLLACTGCYWRTPLFFIRHSDCPVHGDAKVSSP